MRERWREGERETQGEVSGKRERRLRGRERVRGDGETEK